MSHKHINTSFEVLLEQVEDVVGILNQRGGNSLRFGDYEGARNLMQDAEGITFFRHRVKELQNEWQALFGNSENDLGSAKDADQPRGLRTPQETYRLPILACLSELGGKATVEEVLEKVEIKLETMINDYDCESLPSDPRTLRWKSTAFWCGSALVNEELLSNDAQNGMWEITEKGTEYLAEMKADLDDAESSLADVPAITENGNGEDSNSEENTEPETSIAETAPEVAPELKLPPRGSTVKRIS